MDDAVPIIYARPTSVQGMTWQARILAAGVALGCLAPLLAAAMIRPSMDGYGSHTELGMAPCQFMSRTGLPCPSCGMTTSWTWFVRGNLPASFYIQPMGTVLAALAVCGFWIALYAALTGRPAYRMLRVLPGRYYFFPLLIFAVLAWGWKMFIHLGGHDGWAY